MKIYPKLITLVLIVAYIGAGFGVFYMDGIFVWPFLLLPIPLLLSIGVFGSNLEGLSNNLLRALSILTLIACIAISFSMVLYSGEQGAIGILFVGVTAMAAVSFLYCFLLLLQYLRGIMEKINTKRC